MGKEFAKWQAPTENKKMDSKERKTENKKLEGRKRGKASKSPILAEENIILIY